MTLIMIGLTFICLQAFAAGHPERKAFPAAGSPKTEPFVVGTPLLVRYNSRLPIVIYAPAGFDVRYRIGSTAATTGQAERRSPGEANLECGNQLNPNTSRPWGFTA